ncbi:type 1 glutamine amidotransferase domain-containing protein [Streptomyces mexicanus]|uniref:type 1 glutamine amidotransferase domain-containing protein n=1 Tax=Streptomyces mexicanus TaxID=178566 RepID=UPI003666B7EB
MTRAGPRWSCIPTDTATATSSKDPSGPPSACSPGQVLSIRPCEIQAGRWDLNSAGTWTFPADRLVSDASADDYDTLLLPGGTMNPDQLRVNKDAVGFVKAFVNSGKPVATLCHGPWTLVNADVVRGRRLTSWPSIRTDLRHAGAEVVDEEVVIDGQFTSSRSPADLPAFCVAIVEQFARAGRRSPAPGWATGAAP